MDLPSAAGDSNASLRLSRWPPISDAIIEHPPNQSDHVIAMNIAEFQLRCVGDRRLAVHATSALPAWLWSVDGTRVLWANPVAAKLFGAANGAILAKKIFGPADAHRRQVARLAGGLLPTGAVRLERLRGFGASLGTLVTCGCARLEFADGGHGILIAAAESVGGTMPLVERLQRLVEGIDSPIAAFSRDGMLVGASDAARPLLGFRNLSEAGLEAARSDALKQGRVETPIGIGHMVLQRVGTGADIGLVALITPGATVAAHLRHRTSASPQAAPAEPAREPVAPQAEQPTPDYEQPANSGEAPAEFALIEEAAESPAEPAIESIVTDASQIDMPHVEASHAEAPAEIAAPDTERPQDEPSPYVEAVADEPSSPPAKEPSWLDEPAPNACRHPLRFMWQLDAEGRFSLSSDEFIRLIGAHTAAGFGRLWSEIADSFGLDPDGHVARAIASGNTWSGITLNWPVDGGGRLPVELSGLPIYDHRGKLAGYQGFGVCRDLDGLTRLAALRRFELFRTPPAPQTASADIIKADQGPSAANSPSVPDIASSSVPESPGPFVVENSPQTDWETPVETPKETPKNVVPFRPIGEPKSPVLTPVENSAFNELARQLSARLENENDAAAATPAASDRHAGIEPPAAPETQEHQRRSRLAGAARGASAGRSRARPNAARSAPRRRVDLSA